MSGSLAPERQARGDSIQVEYSWSETVALTGSNEVIFDPDE
jgi:hypothetical protein